MSFRVLTFTCPLAAYAATACTNGLMAPDPEADAGGTSGSGGSTLVQNGGSPQTQSGGASTSLGGSTTAVAAQSGGTTGVTGAAGAVACLPPLKALITDFTYSPANPMGSAQSTSSVSFGDYATTYSGGTFVYPEGVTGLTSDVTQGNWHIFGDVTDYAGFGLYNGVGCTKIDASAYKGISFVISGIIATNVPVTANTLTLSVGTAANEITAAWLNANKAPGAADVSNFGRCTPASAANKYDGTCAQPQKAGIPVTSIPTTVTVLWADLASGRPAAFVNPAELVYINWVLPNPTGVGTTAVTPYPVDIVIDDVQFIP